MGKSDEYKYGFNVENSPVEKFEKGLNKEKIIRLSKLKNEPLWMTEFRLKAFKKYNNTIDPLFGPKLNHIDFSSITYYLKETDESKKDWNDVPAHVKETFDKIGIPEAERQFLAGVTTQFESEAVYHSATSELVEKGIIFLDTDTALKTHEEIFRKFFNKIVPYNDNKFASLNSAVWSGGTFIYVPKAVILEKPIQSYFRINAKRMGQFERTLIIVDDDSSIHYVEGCTAPIYSTDSVHAAVVEIYIGKNSKCRYTTIQNWSTDVVNLVTKRALVDEGGKMEWIDGNIGSGINMKYPACILKGDNSSGLTISIAFAGKNQHQDAGAKMIHLGKNTKSEIISKSIAKTKGIVNYRGKVYIGSDATNSKSHIVCDTLLLDSSAKSDTIPTNIVCNNSSSLEHEASVSKISREQLYYLQSRGLSESEAREFIVMGFIDAFSKELPMEYAVELNQLIKLEMKGSNG
jgi:Fe-S cluster assembly protein SufB